MGPLCFSKGKYAEGWLVQRFRHVSGHSASTPELKLMSLRAIFPVDIGFTPESISAPPPTLWFYGGGQKCLAFKLTPCILQGHPQSKGVKAALFLKVKFTNVVLSFLWLSQYKGSQHTLPIISNPLYVQHFLVLPKPTIKETAQCHKHRLWLISCLLSC